MKQRAFHLFVGVLIAISLPLQAKATAWVARQDLSANQYQTEFNLFSSPPYGLRLKSISGYEVGGQGRYAALWTQESGPGWTASHAMTESGFNQLNATLKGQNARLSYISGFTVGGTRYFNAIWEYNTNPDVITEIGLSSGTFAGKVLAHAANGYQLRFASAFTDGNSDAYNGIWVKGARGVPHVAFALSGAQFQTTFNNESAAGYRLVDHTTSVVAGLERHTAVFERNTFAGWYSLEGLSGSNYEGETSNAYYQGYRPDSVSVYISNGKPAFNATWVLNGGMNPAQATHLNKKITDYMALNHVPGLSIAVAKDGRLVYAKGFGYAEMETGDLVNPLNRFRIASVSKPITATAMLRLRDKGTLTSLDKLVFGNGALLGTEYGTSAYSAGEKAITVRHLLSHTTGWQSDGVLWDNAYGVNHAAILSWQLDNVPLSTFPGANYQYQNIDFITAGRVIEHLSGKGYEQFVKDEVLTPSGITDMELGNQTLAGRRPREVRYYQSGGGDPYVTISPKRMDANGGWIAKPMDLLLLMRRIDGVSDNRDIISSGSLTEMRKGSTDNPTYGLGLLSNSTWWGHNGCMDGTISFLVHRTDGFDFAVTCNIRPDNDGCAWTLKQRIEEGIDATPDSAWPDYDLFSSYNTEFDAWTASTFLTTVRNQPGLKADFWGPTGDPDKDGIPNSIEAYFSESPFVANSLHFTPSVIGDDFVVRWRESFLLSHHGVELAPKITQGLFPPHWVDGPGIHTAQGVFNPIGFTTKETREPRLGRSKVFQTFDATTP